MTVHPQTQRFIQRCIVLYSFFATISPAAAAAASYQSGFSSPSSSRLFHSVRRKCGDTASINNVRNAPRSTSAAFVGSSRLLPTTTTMISKNARSCAFQRFSVKARSRDNDDEEDEYEYARVRRRGGRRYEDDDEYEYETERERGRKHGEYYEDEEEDDDEYYDDEDEDEYDDEDDEFELPNMEGQIPLALDLVDPGRTYERWGDIFTDGNFIRDMAIAGSLYFFIDYVCSWESIEFTDWSGMAGM
mmetsp:Transcript_36548/g.53630  ORF Transcript_36548/g.53630 Transcript_36548/m.53630 type:complete len:246 (+) Transcript_36548:138-875(+)|eukprot:CAMPEP_0195524292 /NCGR_PEP_ID=MMETSP0794_2-20130614/24019_1 /TAXON_ID=515487 /ORGANISM="Stephanopyxis turris, Strain CCMP 815" /LENGTH=245 /DNA_ID=CAMNT_0040654475 /DNA_START=108 /DNA_END=845 /DNA_ORIENTATION=+